MPSPKSNRLRYLSAEDILVVHALIIDETGGSHGLRDLPLLQSIAHKPRTEFNGKQLYHSIFLKAAVLAEAVTNYHVFIDGNKRTALVVVARFLALNGYTFAATNEDVESMILAIATKDVNVEQLTLWLKKNVQKLKP